MKALKVILSGLLAVLASAAYAQTYPQGLVNKTIAVIKNKKESEIVAIIKSAEHELCRWQAVHNKMSGGTAD